MLAYTDRFFKLALSLVAVIHCIIFAEMLFLDITPMVIYNIFSICCYLVGIYLIHRRKYTVVYLFAYLEIILHSYIAAICLGWTFGFALYMIALVPVGFYMQYFINENKMGTVLPLLLGILDLAVFISCQMMSDIIEPLYVISDPKIRKYTYTFNAVCTFIMLLCFSTIFLNEMKKNHKELKEINNKLNAMAKLDTLTGLFNRRGIKPFLDVCAVSGRSFCIAMCDIDDFKNVNDSYGHDVGDEVIAETAKIIRADIKPDDHVCRWGGEEFVFIVDNALIADGSDVAEKIRYDIEHRNLEMFGKKIDFTVTIGITQYQEGESIEETISRADEKMYDGKHSGKNVVVADNGLYRPQSVPVTKN